MPSVTPEPANTVRLLETTEVWRPSFELLPRFGTNPQAYVDHPGWQIQQRKMAVYGYASAKESEDVHEYWVPSQQHQRRP